MTPTRLLILALGVPLAAYFVAKLLDHYGAWDESRRAEGPQGGEGVRVREWLLWLSQAVLWLGMAIDYWRRSDPYWSGVASAIAAGSLARTLYLLWQRAKYRTQRSTEVVET